MSAEGQPAPPPGEWHPAYLGQDWLVGWLSDDPRYSHDVMRIPVERRLKAFSAPEVALARAPSYRTLTRRRAAGPAPFVGRPFHYEWWVGVDDLGRMVAGDSRIVYTGRYVEEEE